MSSLAQSHIYNLNQSDLFRSFWNYLKLKFVSSKFQIFKIWIILNLIFLPEVFNCSQLLRVLQNYIDMKQFQIPNVFLLFAITTAVVQCVATLIVPWIFGTYEHKLIYSYFS